MPTRFKCLYPLLESLILLLQFAPFNLDLIGVVDRLIDKVETIVRSISLLLDDGDVFAQGLLSVLQLALEPLDILLLHYLLVWLLKSDFPAQILHLSICIRLYSRDLLLLSAAPDFV